MTETTCPFQAIHLERVRWRIGDAGGEQTYHVIDPLSLHIPGIYGVIGRRWSGRARRRTAALEDVDERT